MKYANFAAYHKANNGIPFQTHVLSFLNTNTFTCCMLTHSGTAHSIKIQSVPLGYRESDCNQAGVR